MKVGFIGVGNLATAVIKGLISSDFHTDIIGYDIDSTHLDLRCRELGIEKASSLAELITVCDTIFLAVKPNQLHTTIQSIRDLIKLQKPLVVSLAAGKTIAQLEESFAFKTPLVRVMASLNSEFMESMTAISPNTEVSQEQLHSIENLFASIGKTIILDETYFSIFTAVAGCSPAFTYIYIDSLAKAAHKSGLKKNDALKIAAQAVIGSAKMLLASDEHPMALVDKVCSPGGSTIEGVCVLDENAFQSIVVKAVEASCLKDKHLGSS